MAPVPPPLAAARSRVCHGSLYGLPLLLSPSPDSAMCHFQVSLHCCGFHFVIGCCMAFHCCCLHRHPAPCASGAVWPPIAAVSKCAVILRSTALICMSY
ncbi:unnamed protein product [Staurois parvus]|uniref:Uncharacterized protein n=1 Tax=Staurois parvus TaxID=386267 RepID=A0ABN9BZY6_9NEOB|nr:unnamed protein product [Staurois parvus]